jgi:tRNA dimethylallyltransferase
MQSKKIIILSGPTAMGKTYWATELGLLYGCPVLNFDSLLFYKELQIGVAKPTLEERKNVPHYLMDICSVSTPLTAADYEKSARALLEDLWKVHEHLILVGGSGFYLQALLEGMYSSEQMKPEIAQRSHKLYEEQGITPFIEELKEVDSARYLELHVNDHYRIRRAVEYFWLTGKPMSKAREELAQKKIKTPRYVQEGWSLLHLYLDRPKEEHWISIQERTKQMIQLGLIEEVQSLLKNFSGDLKPLQSIGYKEVQAYFSGHIKTLTQLEEDISIHTRQLAKAQRTWFAKKEKHTLHPITDKDHLLALCHQFLK